MIIPVPDNQNVFVGGYDTDILLSSNAEESKSLHALAEMSVWELIDKNHVSFVNSSFGKEEGTKGMHIIELGHKNTDEGDKLVIYTNNILAFLSYGKKTKLVIHSRFDDGENNFFLFHMFEKVCGVSLSHLKSQSNKLSVLDIYPLFFPRLLKSAISQGLFRSYVSRSYNNNKVKGRIDIARHIRYNIPFNGNIAYSAREYSEDNAVMQLVRHTIEYISSRKKWTSLDAETKAAIEIVCQATPTYDLKRRNEIININETKVVNHSYYSKYRALQNLCLAILKHRKAGVGNGNGQQINGILIDGAWLWEEYIANVLNQKRDDSNKITFRHYTDKNSHFSLFEGFTQKIIPDYLSDDYNEAENKATAVADAKYMRLEGKDKLQGEQAYSVYYKTIMYMHRFNSKKGFIFYPIEANAEGSVHDIKELSIAGTDSKIYMCGFRIPKIEASKDPDGFTKFKSAMEKAEEDFRNQIKNYLTNN